VPPDLQREELTTEEWRTIMLKLKRWLGEFSFIFSGGEPLLRKDIFDLISFAVKNRLHPYVISNGCAFGTVARKIVASGLESLTVSLNGVNPSTHDITRGVKGAHGKTLKFIGAVKSHRRRLNSQMKMSIQTILMPINYDEAVDLVKWANGEGLDGIQFQPLDRLGPIQPSNTIDYARVKAVNSEWHRSALAALAAENEKLDKVIDELIRYKKQGYPIATSVEQLNMIKIYYRGGKELFHFRCGIGVSRLNVDPYGYVRQCFEAKAIGNMKLVSPDKLYNSEKAVKQRQTIRKCNNACHWLISTQ